MDSSVFIGFVLAIVLWGLIGIEREMPRHGIKPSGATGFWGIRTYASISFFGAIAAWLDMSFWGSLWTLFGAILSGLFLLVSYGYSAFEKNRWTHYVFYLSNRFAWEICICSYACYRTLINTCIKGIFYSTEKSIFSWRTWGFSEICSDCTRDLATSSRCKIFYFRCRKLAL